MNHHLEPEELNALLGAYALGAVSDEEREQIDQHLLEHPEARAELHQVEHAAAWLAHASPRPQESSWAAVKQAIDDDLKWRNPASPPVALDSARAARSARRTTVARRVLAIAASLLVIVGIGLTVQTLADDSSPTEQVAQTRFALRAPDGTVAARIVVNATGAGTVRAADLPELPAGTEYQFWARPDPEAPMVSAGLLGRRIDRGRVQIPVASTEVAISVEPTGGSAAPTTDPVAFGELPRA